MWTKNVFFRLMWKTNTTVSTKKMHRGQYCFVSLEISPNSWKSWQFNPLSRQVGWFSLTFPLRNNYLPCDLSSSEFDISQLRSASKLPFWLSVSSSELPGEETTPPPSTCACGTASSAFSGMRRKASSILMMMMMMMMTMIMMMTTTTMMMMMMMTTGLPLDMSVTRKFSISTSFEHKTWSIRLFWCSPSHVVHPRNK